MTEKLVEDEKPKTSRDLIVESGIAGRILATLKRTHQGTEDPEITFGVEDCGFSVRTTEDPHTKKLHTQVIVEMPNLYPENRKTQPLVSQVFGVEAGESFGTTGEPPLSAEQLDLVMKLAR